MDKIICQVCGTGYPGTAAQCPICGYAKPAAPKAPVSDGSSGSYQYVRGGRFSSANVRKRNEQKAAPVSYQRPAAPAPAPVNRQQKPSGSKGSNFIFGIIAIILLVALILSLAWFIVDIAISRLSGVQPPVTETEPPLQNATLSANVSQLSFTQAGETQSVIPVLVPEDLDAVYLFTSADAAIATVDDNGVVTAVSEGSTTITIATGDLSFDIAVTCRFEDSSATTEPSEPEPTDATEQPSAAELKISHTDVTIAVNETFVLQLRDSNKKSVEVEWKVSEEGIVTVDGNKITGAKGGSNVVVSATVDGKTYKCTVRVKK